MQPARNGGVMIEGGKTYVCPVQDGSIMVKVQTNTAARKLNAVHSQSSETGVCDIFYTLINEAGRLCEWYSSEVMNDIRNIQKNLFEKTDGSCLYVFGMHRSGVHNVRQIIDSNTVYSALWGVLVETKDRNTHIYMTELLYVKPV